MIYTKFQHNFINLVWQMIFLQQRKRLGLFPKVPKNSLISFNKVVDRKKCILHALLLSKLLSKSKGKSKIGTGMEGDLRMYTMKAKLSRTWYAFLVFSYPSWSSKVSVAPETFLNSLLTFVKSLKAPPISYSFQHIPSEAILVESPSVAGFPKSPLHYCSPPYLRIQG